MFFSPDGSALLPAREALRQVHPRDRKLGPLDPTKCTGVTWYSLGQADALLLTQFDSAVETLHTNNWEDANPSQHSIRAARHAKDVIDHWLASLWRKGVTNNFLKPLPLTQIDDPDLINALKNIRLNLPWDTGVPSASVAQPPVIEDETKSQAVLQEPEAGPSSQTSSLGVWEVEREEKPSQRNDSAKMKQTPKLPHIHIPQPPAQLVPPNPAPAPNILHPPSHMTTIESDPEEIVFVETAQSSGAGPSQVNVKKGRISSPTGTFPERCRDNMITNLVSSADDKDALTEYEDRVVKRRRVEDILFKSVKSKDFSLAEYQRVTQLLASAEELECSEGLSKSRGMSSSGDPVSARLLETTTRCLTGDVCVAVRFKDA